MHKIYFKDLKKKANGYVPIGWKWQADQVQVD